MKNNEIVDAEIVEDEFLAPERVTAKELKILVNVDSLIEKYQELSEIPLDTDVETLQERFLEIESARKEFTNGRIELEKKAKSMRDPFNAFAKLVIKIEKEVQAKINPFENKLRALTDKVENEEKRKQCEAEEAEELRIDSLKSKIREFEMLPLVYINNSSDEILAILTSSESPTKEIFEEFFDEAATVFTNSHAQLRKISDDKILVENAQKIQDEADEKARIEREAVEKKLQDEKDEFEKEKALLQKEKNDFKIKQDAIQEAVNLKEAERVADELLKKQEADKVEKQRELSDFTAKCYDETMDAMGKIGSVEGIIEAIMRDEIPHVKWEI